MASPSSSQGMSNLLSSIPFLTPRRLGLEGLITFKKDTHEYDAESYTISVPTSSGSSAVIGVFDKVIVEVGIEKDQNTQRGKVRMVLVEPVSSVGL
jgi:exosome complex exonuclease DIS3/RRP44